MEKKCNRISISRNLYFQFIGDATKPVWRMSLCGGNAAAVAARAGTKLLVPKIRITWNPPSSPYQHTEKLRLVVTAVNSGELQYNTILLEVYRPYVNISLHLYGIISLKLHEWLPMTGRRSVGRPPTR